MSILSTVKQTLKKGQYIKTICQATGWTKDKAKQHLDAAKAIGMPYGRYMTRKCWTLSLDQIIALNNRVEAHLNKRAEIVPVICAETGWSEEAAKAHLEAAYKAGMPYARYMENRCWNMDLAQIIELNKKINEHLKEQEVYVRTVCKETGWSKDKAAQHLEEAYNAGVPYQRYVLNKCWKLSLAQTVALHNRIESRMNDRADCTRMICQRTGWSEKSVQQYLDKGYKMGIPYRIYTRNKCWEMDEEQLDAFCEKEQMEQTQCIFTICQSAGLEEKDARKMLTDAYKAGVPYRIFVLNKCWNRTLEQTIALNARIDVRLEEKSLWVDSISKASGLTPAAAEKKFNQAKKLDIPLERYVAYKYWELAPKDIPAMNAKLDAVDTVCQVTGWTETEILAAFDNAKALGITYKEYVAHCGWEFTQEELKELKELLDLNREYVKQDDLWHVNVIREKTGWTEEYAFKRMRAAQKKGYPFKAFIRQALWKKTEEEVEALPPRKVKLSKTKQESIRKKAAQADEYRKLIMEEMGWSAGRVRLEAFRSAILCGTSDAEFYLFKIYKYGIDHGNKFITARYNSRMNTRYASWDGGFRLFENKGQFNQDFKDFIHRKWFLSEGMSYEQFKQETEGLKKIICKPLNGIEGIGIEIFELDGTEESSKAVYDRISQKGRTIVEDFIKQHREISEFYPTSVNTMRVMSFLDNGQGKILNSVIKFGTRANVDNYYQGGIAAGIDVNTGKICTDGVDYAGTIYKTHPYSGKTFNGFQIPHWDDLVELIRVAAAIHPESPYVGWDIAISENGPEIVEGNHNQGSYLCQYPFAIYSLEGKRYTMDPYLWFDK